MVFRVSVRSLCLIQLPIECHFAAEVKNFDPEKYMDAKEARRRDRFEQLGVAAAQRCSGSSGLEDHRSELPAGLVCWFHRQSVGSSRCRMR